MPYAIVPTAERFWKRVEKTDTCWLWQGALWEGYGAITVDRGTKTLRVHRYAYELLVGPIPEGLTLDHLCLVKHCVNPEHLEPVTQSENSIRANRGRAACKSGHLYAEHGFSLDKKGRRYCNTCKAATIQRQIASQKAERAAKRVTRTHCKQGHKYTPETTYVSPKTGWRTCKPCRLENRKG